MNPQSAVVPSRRPGPSPIDAPMATGTEGKATHLSLHAALRRTLAFDVPLPGAAMIDLLESGEDVWVAARDAELRATLRSLLAHAIRHCPVARRVEVLVQAACPGATVIVRDAVPRRGDAAKQAIDAELVALRADAQLLEPDLGRLQSCARRLGARVRIADSSCAGQGSPYAHRVVLSVQFPPPFNVIVRDA
jgi:hypothetical protein